MLRAGGVDGSVPGSAVRACEVVRGAAGAAGAVGAAGAGAPLLEAAKLKGVTPLTISFAAAALPAIVFARFSF